MKRYIWLVLALGLVVCALFTVSRRSAASTAAQSENGERPSSVTLFAPTRGVVFKTAAINSDGTVANCFRCNKANTLHLETGVYQVDFDENVMAINGWSRWIQVDTLSTGSIDTGGLSCTTADRAGVSDAVWVACHDGAGNRADTSFFIFVAR